MHTTHNDAKRYLKRFTWNDYSSITYVEIKILLMYNRRITYYVKRKFATRRLGQWA